MRVWRATLFGGMLAGGFSGVALSQGFKIPPTPDHYVTDTAGALSSSTRGSLENQLQAYERETGHQIVVWIGQTTGDVPLETWTGEAADHWKIGRRGHDDGALLFVFMRDRKVRLEVGYGLESALTDADSHRIVSDVIVPRMRSGDVDGAVSSGVNAMLTTISPSYRGATPPPEYSGAPVRPGALTFMVVVFGLSILFAVFLVILEVTRELRYGYLVMREGRSAARKDMRSWPAWGWGLYGGAGSFGGFGGGGFGGFSAGGGGFGGGGASGGW
ncbi:MAG: TPM domain-containing protein [Candidatus Eremiobacteraeota bacterium]|nr:TPM domain-containing protein [Candidatus Eremiobacteraeota bacterium]MBV9056365.1 TPM domain-containing protein [Candidatus Eremiobacteraeota bacterium]